VLTHPPEHSVPARPGLAAVVVWCVAAAGAALLVYQWAGGIPLWLDEEMLALNVRGRTLFELAGPLWLAQAAPYGWLAAERLALLAAGTSEQALRATPLLFGIGTLAAAAWVGARWLGPWGGGVLTLLCAFSPWLSYHAVEVKPYSADAFWALLLPALAAWVLERDRTADARGDQRHVAAWWAAAAVSHWFGTGALLVTPACAVVLHAVLWRRHGWRGSARAALPALGWVASFALHYQVSLRHALGSDFLQNYWSVAMPPRGADIPTTLSWLGSRLHPLAVKPVGTSHSWLFWSLVAGGAAVALRARPAAGVLLTAVPISAFVWTGLRLVPMFERLSLWVVPALFVAIGIAAAALARLAGRAIARRQLVALAGALAGAAAVAIVLGDIADDGLRALTTRPTANNHDLDDRGGIRWLLARARPGDIFATTHLGLPAVWWYGNLGVPQKAEGGGRRAAWPVFEIRTGGGSGRCEPSLAGQLGQPKRVLLYLGFRFDDWPKAYDDVLFARLAEVGEVVGYRTFANAGIAMVVDLRRPPAPGYVFTRPGTEQPPSEAMPRNCIDAVPARAW
jgi:hypothetical protein